MAELLNFDAEIQRLVEMDKRSISVTELDWICFEICRHAQRDADYQERLKQWVLSAVVPDSGASHETVGYFFEVFRWPEVVQNAQQVLAAGLNPRLTDFYRMILQIAEAGGDDRDMFKTLKFYPSP